MSKLLERVAARDFEGVRALLAKGKAVYGDIDAKDGGENSALNFACAFGTSEDVILELLAAGASVKTANKSGGDPLKHSVYSRLSVNVLKAIFKAGADPNAQNQSGGTALQIACVVKSPLDVIECLVENGADVDLGNSHGHTPLMFAVRNHCDLEILNFLVSKTKTVNGHTDVDDPKYPGFTALHFSAGEFLPAHSAILINAGADSTITNKEGHTALQLCDEKTKTAILSAKFAKFAAANPPPPEAVAAASLPVILKATTPPSGRVPLRRTSMLAQTMAGNLPEQRAGSSSGGGVLGGLAEAADEAAKE